MNLKIVMVATESLMIMRCCCFTANCCRGKSGLRLFQRFFSKVRIEIVSPFRKVRIEVVSPFATFPKQRRIHYSRTSLL